MMIERKVRGGMKATKSLAEWAALFEEHLGIPADTIIYRVLTLKWDAERAFTTPKKEINYNPNRNPRLEKKEVKSAMVQKTFYKYKDKQVRQSKFKMIEWCGQTKSLYDWAVELSPQLGISITTMERRVIWRNWDIERAFTTPFQKVG
jgi:hypothetical protein